MSKRAIISIADLQKTACAKLNLFLFEKQPVTRKVRKDSKEKVWILANLQEWCTENGHELKEEYRFHPLRKWRYDYCIVDLKIAFEYEGIFSEKSRHTTISGYTGDIDKYNAAIGEGWKVLRYTAKNYQQIINDLNNLL